MRTIYVTLAVMVMAAPAWAESKTSTVSESETEEEDEGGDGASLAEYLAVELDNGTLTKKRAEQKFLALSEEEREAFLDEWRRITEPEGEALQLYGHLKTRLKSDAKSVKSARSERYRSKAQPRRDPEMERLLLESRQKSVPVAVILSLFIGFGTGNFYADAPGTAIAALSGEVLGGGLIIGGAAAESTGLFLVGLVVHGSARILDVAGAYTNSMDYNRALFRRHAVNETLFLPSTREAPPLPPGTFVFALPF